MCLFWPTPFYWNNEKYIGSYPNPVRSISDLLSAAVSRSGPKVARIETPSFQDKGSSCKNDRIFQAGGIFKFLKMCLWRQERWDSGGEAVFWMRCQLRSIRPSAQGDQVTQDEDDETLTPHTRQAQVCLLLSSCSYLFIWFLFVVFQSPLFVVLSFLLSAICCLSPHLSHSPSVRLSVFLVLFVSLSCQSFFQSFYVSLSARLSYVFPSVLMFVCIRSSLLLSGCHFVSLAVLPLNGQAY